VQPAINLSKASASVISFKKGSQSASKTVGQVPTSYKQGSGTLVSGTKATKATKAALTSYAGGIVDRVVQLSNGDYEVHNIGVSWPHHIFVNQDFKVIAPTTKSAELTANRCWPRACSRPAPVSLGVLSGRSDRDGGLSRAAAGSQSARPRWVAS